jgi:hypothetical protein
MLDLQSQEILDVSHRDGLDLGSRLNAIESYFNRLTMVNTIYTIIQSEYNF